MSAASATSQGLPRSLLSRAATVAAAGLREVWEIMNAPANLRAKLLQMASECEASQPEQAARMRKLAVSPWNE